MPQRGTSRPAGRDAVVDDDHRAAGQRGHRPLPAIPPYPALELDLLPRFDGRELFGGDTPETHDVGVEDADAAFTDGAHAELGLLRHAELADDDHVEGRMKRPSHLERDRHAAPRQCEHDRMFRAPRFEPCRQCPTRVAPVVEAPELRRPRVHVLNLLLAWADAIG